MVRNMKRKEENKRVGDRKACCVLTIIDQGCKTSKDHQGINVDRGKEDAHTLTKDGLTLGPDIRKLFSDL